ncbi:hypothetical protein LCGC14_2539520 [marine sediment metagenome]|uniref:Uncharacterized protein n=1 Tax=marine sediment metagenome TaxID=412755 RepID=A0A0F9BDX0_9ZZZZ
MTYGTATCIKSGTGLIIAVPKDIELDQKLVRGSKVQFDMTRLKNIEPQPRKKGFAGKKVDVKNESPEQEQPEEDL